MQVELTRAIITEEMVGFSCWLPANTSTEEELKKLGWGEVLVGELNEKYDYRSREQMNLYWACCKLIVDNYSGEDQNNWNTKEKVSEQIKIKLRFVDYYIRYYDEALGDYGLHIKTKSISYKEMHKAESVEFFGGAFEEMAKVLGITKDVLIQEAKAKMVSCYKICKKCGKKATQKHHKLKNVKMYRKKYKGLLQESFNFEYYCKDCHSSHAKLSEGDMWDEVQFIASALANEYDPLEWVEDKYRKEVEELIERAKEL